MLQKLNHRLHNRKGFTLIELIVVIAIVAILAAVLIPRFVGFTKDAEMNAVRSDARNILLAIEALNASGKPYMNASNTIEINKSEINDYSGKKYFVIASGDPGTCDNLVYISAFDESTNTKTDAATNTAVKGFYFEDKQGDTIYKAVVLFDDSTIVVYE